MDLIWGIFKLNCPLQRHELYQQITTNLGIKFLVIPKLFL